MSDEWVIKHKSYTIHRLLPLQSRFGPRHVTNALSTLSPRQLKTSYATHLLVKRSLLILSVLLLVSSLPLWSAHAEDQRPNQEQEKQLKGAVIVPPRDRFGDIAPGAAEDTLKACLARIPEQATVGQRMLAEQTCEREEAIRKTYQGIRGL